jgi:hypothetical protein
MYLYMHLLVVFLFINHQSLVMDRLQLITEYLSVIFVRYLNHRGLLVIKPRTS